MKFALAQINTTVGDLEGNAEKIRRAARHATSRGAEVVVFPELALTSYPPRDLLLRESFLRRQEDVLERLARELGRTTTILGFVSRNTGGGKPLRNSVAVLAEGRVAAVRHKTLLPTYDVFDERRYFEPAAGNEPLDLLGRPLGLTICEDAWADYAGREGPEYGGRDPVRALCEAGVDIVVNIAASPFTVGKSAARESLLSAHARRADVPLLYVNQVGGNDELVFDGDSQVYGPDGTRRLRAARFREDLLLVDVEALPAPVEAAPEPEVRTIHAAIGLGLRDFVHKCGFSRVVLGLSGGIDSSVTAALAAEALGPENVTGVSMPSTYSSPASREDAEALARNLGIGFEVIPIAPAFDALRIMLAEHLGDREAADITEQNLQARIRGVVIMALANRHGWLALATGNKSELATGYCTLYGDMCGALAPLGDVLKTQVYALAEEINRERVVIPQRVLTRPPSAELRPGQTDQDTLPVYAVLDGILRAYVEEEADPEEILARGFDRDAVRDTVRRVLRSEHKRRQAPPCLKVTSRAFGHGRRLPIACRLS